MNMLHNEVGWYLRRALFAAASSASAFLATLHSAKAEDWNHMRVMIVTKDVGMTDGPIIAVPCGDNCDYVPFSDPYLDAAGRPVDPSSVPVTGTLRNGTLVKILATHQETRWNYCGSEGHICGIGGNSSTRIDLDWVFVVAVDSDGNLLSGKDGKPIENWITTGFLRNQ